MTPRLAAPDTCRRTTVGVALVLLLTTVVVSAGSPGSASSGPGEAGAARLLDVPYLPQSEDLCGGAAVAMVLRYWGEPQVYPEDFAALVDRSAAGIRTDVLTTSVNQRRGWQARLLEADPATRGEGVRRHVEHGRPVIALIQVGPDRYHYVVVVAWTGDRVIVHDPARVPFRVFERAEFERAWATAGHWALLVLPADADAPGSAVSLVPEAASGESEAPLPSGPCASLVAVMVSRAAAGDVAGAEAGLLAATGLCPDEPSAWRELAGVRFLQSRWADASALAGRATRLDPLDEQGWNLLATSRFLNDEADRALDAWNRIGLPVVDLVRVEGSRRTRHPVISSLVDLPPRTLLTPERFGLAQRRLQELPSAAVTRARYRPVPGGLAEVEVAVVERRTLPRGLVPIAAAAGRAWIQRELELDLVSPTGSGEVWSAAWRLWEARPRVAFVLAMPAPSGLPGVATVEGLWERQSYAVPANTSGLGRAAILQQERRRAGVSLADWATRRLRWHGGVALDRWDDDSHVSIGAGIDWRLARDRVSLGAEWAAWEPLGSGSRFSQGSITSNWRSTRESTRALWLATAGLSVVSDAARLDVWPGAGTGFGRTPLLRAHPLLDGGVVTGETFGRGLLHGTLEYQHPVFTRPGGTVRLAAFADAARAWRPLDGGTSVRPQVDVGAGLRLALPGAGGVARIDLARGLRSGHTRFSAGWQLPWPGR